MLPNTEIKQQEPTKQAPTTEADAPPSANEKKNVTYGFLVGLLAAICYGFIPFFTLPIKSGATENFMSDPTILFYRFGFASIILAIVMLIRRISFKVTRGELVTLIYLAFISDGSALFLIDGYNYMSSGVATTLHFMYPVVTAIIMMTFYNEARRLSTIWPCVWPLAVSAFFLGTQLETQVSAASSSSWYLPSAMRFISSVSTVRELPR